MSRDRHSIPVSLPEDLVVKLDELVEDGRFDSRSDALRYGARLLTRGVRIQCLHELSEARAKSDVAERLGRKTVP